MQRRRFYVGIPMNVFGNINALMVQHRIFYADIPMDVFAIVNLTMIQCYSCHSDIPMNVFAMVDVVTMQRRIFNANTSMDMSTMMNVLITQLGTSCSFDSPGLARNEPTPGKHLWRHAYNETFHGELIKETATPMALVHANVTLTQGSLHYRLATLGYQKRNTYGVEIFIL